MFVPYLDKSIYPIVGGDPGAVARAQGKLLDYAEWQNLCDVAQENVTLKKQLEKLVNLYYVVKDEYKQD